LTTTDSALRTQRAWPGVDASEHVCALQRIAGRRCVVSACVLWIGVTVRCFGSVFFGANADVFVQIMLVCMLHSATVHSTPGIRLLAWGITWYWRGAPLPLLAFAVSHAGSAGIRCAALGRRCHLSFWMHGQLAFAMPARHFAGIRARARWKRSQPCLCAL